MRERQTRVMAHSEGDVEKVTSVEAYLESLHGEPKAALLKLREAIASVLPAEAEEGVTYGMPGFLLNGKGLVGYMAFRDHYSLFPMGPEAIEAHREELGDLVTGKGTISFEYGKRLPVSLVKKVVRMRVAQASAKRK
jgi:uncharacterized protein YdhG (YjbR/CyaY superfamily)